MSLRHYLFLFLLGALGYAALALLSPRFNPSANWHYTFDRDGAIAHARREASRRGFDTSRWDARVTGTNQNLTTYYLARRGQREETALLSPVNTPVLLVEPGGERRRIRVDLTTGGRVAGFVYRDANPPTTEAMPIEATRGAAQVALNQLIGSEAAQFQQVSEVDQGAEGVRFNWERTIPGDTDIKLQVTSLVRGETIKEVILNEKFAPRLQDEFNNRRREAKLLELLSFISVMVTALAVGVFFLLSLARGEIDYWSALILFLALLLFGIVLRIFTGHLDSVLLPLELKADGAIPPRYILGLVQTALVSFFYALGLSLVWSAGRALARRSDPHRLASFAALLKGKLLTKPLAARAAIGIMLGGALGAIPYLVAASNLFPSLVLDRPSPTSLMAPAPALAWLTLPISFTFFTLYGFLTPLLSNYVKAPRIIRALGLLIGFIWLIGDLYETSIPGAVVIGGLTILIADGVFHRYDLLTLLIASLAADVATGAGALLAQLSSGLQASGWRALAGLGVMLVATLVVSWRGRDAQIEDELEALPVNANSELQKAERERLMAEFGVARKAQQQMLPVAPPKIPGYDIAATCRPAREVGGDLYDFLVLPDERIGIVVADVSGKGVPAALYMTLTKGLLASVAEYESDPSAILREVNRHLYEVCRRKVFVTMILGVLDPPTQTLTYARAGHNPGIWRDSMLQKQNLLGAAGLGLGLNKGRLFDQTLRHESIRVGRGDVVLFYSDGITEAMNAHGEEFGEARLLSIVARTDGLNAVQTRDEIIAEVGAFLGETAPQDDMTLVVVRVAENL